MWIARESDRKLRLYFSPRRGDPGDDRHSDSNNASALCRIHTVGLHRLISGPQAQLVACVFGSVFNQRSTSKKLPNWEIPTALGTM